MRPGKISRISPRRRRGASTIEYVLILIVFVIPVALLLSQYVAMIQIWGSRLLWVFKGPFP